MTIETVEADTADLAFSTLEKLSRDGYTCFRGHRDYRWRIESTFSRHRKIPLRQLTTHELDKLINEFIVNLSSIGLSLPFDQNSRRGRLEYARHYGVPSPLIDFSQSPYVALFFAFNGVRPSDASSGDKAAVYCLKVGQLASVWAKQHLSPIGTEAGSQHSELLRAFLYETEPLSQKDTAAGS
jgi:hypothetical protein